MEKEKFDIPSVELIHISDTDIIKTSGIWGEADLFNTDGFYGLPQSF